eukprot:1869411-Pyramimonas_sp.AAC.1
MPPAFLWQCAPRKGSFVLSRVLSNQVRLYHHKLLEIPADLSDRTLGPPEAPPGAETSARSFESFCDY